MSILSASMWADDVILTETYSCVANQGIFNKAWQGDLCSWYSTQTRWKTDSIIVGSKKYRAALLALTTNGTGQLETTDLEGGIKAVSFYYARSGGNNIEGNSMQLKVSAGTIDHYTDSYSKNGLTITSSVIYNHTFNCKTNGQLIIKNNSVETQTKVENTLYSKILVYQVKVTPYLLYRNKDVTVGLKQRGYANSGSQDFINNTGGEGTITFSSSATGVATVDENGVITPVSVGTTTITATWSEGASTTYTLHVVDGIVVENFSKIVQTSVSGTSVDGNWEGDLFAWTAIACRRGPTDTIGLNPRIQATWLANNTSPSSSLASTNAIEGGVKHLKFRWRVWSASVNTTTKIAITYNGEVMTAATLVQGAKPIITTDNIYDEDINGTVNAVLKLENASFTTSTNAAVNNRVVIENIKITPYLLYTTKAATLDTRNGLTYTNNDLIDNTTGDAVVYSISPTGSGATINSSTGQVTATDATDGDFTVTATWGEVTTTYTLTIVSRIVTTASYADAAKRVGLDALAIVNPLTYTDGYDGTIAYSSSNTAVATVASNGTVSLAGGVGQTTITASLPQTENYKAASASYILYVEDNSASVQVEAFSEVPDGNAAAHMGMLWQGDVCEWRVSADGGVRKNSDKFASDQTRTGIWMGTPDPNTSYGSLTAENGVEGGIKHLWFYCEQPYNTSEVGYTLKPVVYLDEAIEANKVGEVEVVGTSGADNIAANRKLFGASNVMKSNSVLIIRNESFKTDDATRPAANSNRGRLLLDNIHITPYLLYTDKTKQTLRIGGTYTRTPDIDNTDGETGTLTYSSSNTEVATVNSSNGQVTGVARGTATITAKYAWSVSEYVTTTYEVEVFPVNCETFSQNATTHTYATSSEEYATEDKATWYAWLGGIKPSNWEPNVAIIRAPYTNEAGPAYLRSSVLTGGIASMTFDWNIVDTENSVDNWDIRIFVNGREVKRLSNTDIDVTERMENFAQITIDAINEPDNFVIRFENHSTIDGEYTSGNKARFVIDNITWTSYAGTKTLSESADNSGWISSNSGEERNVTISRSALVGGVWNTLCLPFAISKADDLGGAEVQELSSASLVGDVLEIGFTALADDELEAGKPYLVKPAANKDISGTYSSKTISANTAIDYNPVKLQGICSPAALVKDDYSTLFVGTPDGEGNNLYYPSADGTLKGFRAYFKISEESAPAAPLRRARFVVDEQKVVTEIDATEKPAESLRKEIRDGQMVIIREGVQYDVLGRKREL